MTIEQGRITNVVIDDSGTDLTANAAIGAVTLFVSDAYPFNPDGGTLELNGVSMAYTAADYDLKAITVPPLAAAASAEDRVFVLPRGSVKVAMVMFEDDQEEGIRAIIPFHMHAELVDGIRDYNDQETVFVSDESGRWEVKSLDEEIPIVGGEYVNGEGLPEAEPELPPIAPTPTTLTGPAAVIINFDYLRGLTYSLHMVDSDPVVSGAVPGAGNLHTDNVRNNLWVYTDVNGSPLPAETPRWWAIRVRNSSGTYAPNGGWVEGSAGAIPPEYLVMLVGTLIAQRLIGETVSGVRIEGSILDIANAIYAEEGLLNVFATYAELNSALFKDNVERRGLNNILRGQESLSAGVGNPRVGPTVDTTYPSYRVYVPDGGDGADIPGPDMRGLDRVTLAGGVGDRYCSIFMIGTTILAAYYWNPTTGEVTHSTTYTGTALSGFEPLGMAVIGSNMYLIGKAESAGQYQVRKLTIGTPSGATVALSYTGTNWDVMSLSATTKRPGVGRRNISGIDYVATAYYQNDGNIRYKEYNVAGGLTYSVECSAVSSDPADIVGVAPEGTLNLYVFRRNADARKFIRSSGNAVPTLDMPTPNFSINGAFFDDAGDDRFHALTATATCRTRMYANRGSGTAVRTDDWTFTWADTDAGGLGIAETAASPETPFTTVPGGWMRVKVQPPDDLGDPDDPNSAYVYANDNQQGTALTVSELNNGIVFEELGLAGGAPASNEFALRPSSSNGRITSGAVLADDDMPQIEWMGNGEFRLTGDNVYDSGDLTPTGSFTGRVRFTRYGKTIHYEGYIDRDDDFGTADTTVTGITIPTWARPASEVLTAAMPGYSNPANVYRYRFKADGTFSIQRNGVITTFMAFAGDYNVA